MNILHLINDAGFFIFFQNAFRTHPNISNRYVAFVNDKKTPLKYINDLTIWRVVEKEYFYSPYMTEDLSWCDCLVIHFLSPMAGRMIKQAPSNVIIVWSGWGADYYDYINPDSRYLLQQDTYDAINEIKHGVFKRIVVSAKNLLRKSKQSMLNKFVMLPAIKAVDLFSSPIPEDFELLRKALGSTLQADYVQLNYGGVKETFSPGENFLTGQDILVGNSATATNNHLEIFKLLSKQDLGNRNVIVPLSYGDKAYKDLILSIGKKLLDNHFEPILDLMPLVDYNNLIGRCSIVIMNQLRQQALGNIGTMLFKGARVYLNEQNPVYHFFNKRGAHIFNINSLEVIKISTLAQLSHEEVEQNRRVLESFWGRQVVTENVSRFIRTVEQLRKQKI